MHSIVIAQFELFQNETVKNTEELKQNKCGIEKFNDLRNKIFRRVEELEISNKKSTKEVFHMENYIRTLAEKISGLKGVKINPYSVVKYYFASKDPTVKNYVQERISQK